MPTATPAQDDRIVLVTIKDESVYREGYVITGAKKLLAESRMSVGIPDLW